MHLGGSICSALWDRGERTRADPGKTRNGFCGVLVFSGSFVGQPWVTESSCVFQSCLERLCDGTLVFSYAWSNFIPFCSSRATEVCDMTTRPTEPGRTLDGQVELCSTISLTKAVEGV